MTQIPIPTGEVELTTSCYSTLSKASAGTYTSTEEPRPPVISLQTDVALEALAKLVSSGAVGLEHSATGHADNLSIGQSSCGPALVPPEGPAILKAALDLFMKGESAPGSAHTRETYIRLSPCPPTCESSGLLELCTPTNTLQEGPPFSKGQDTFEGCLVSPYEEHNDLETTQLFEGAQGSVSVSIGEKTADSCTSSDTSGTANSTEPATRRVRVPTPIPRAPDSAASGKSQESPLKTLGDDSLTSSEIVRKTKDRGHRNKQHPQSLKYLFNRLRIAAKRKRERTLSRAKTFKTMMSVRGPRTKRSLVMGESLYNGLRSNTLSRSKSKQSSFQDALSIFDDRASNEFQLHLDSLCSSKINLSLDFDLCDIDNSKAREPQTEALADKMYPWKTRTCSSDAIISPVASAPEPIRPEHPKRSGIVESITNFWPSRSSRNSEPEASDSSPLTILYGVDVACNF